MALAGHRRKLRGDFLRACPAATTLQGGRMLDGVWIPQAVEFGGGPVPLPSSRLLIKNDRYTMEAEGAESDRGSLHFNHAEVPSALDIVCESGAGAGRTIRAICRWRGDLLQLSYFAEDTARRPADFRTAQGSLQVMVRYRREAPPVPPVAE
ncbi:MAG: hypothetical protein ABII82_09725 [Verrucomicrobiota bacterium]